MENDITALRKKLSEWQDIVTKKSGNESTDEVLANQAEVKTTTKESTASEIAAQVSKEDEAMSQLPDNIRRFPKFDEDGWKIELGLDFIEVDYVNKTDAEIKEKIEELEKSFSETREISRRLNQEFFRNQGNTEIKELRQSAVNKGKILNESLIALRNILKNLPDASEIQVTTAHVEIAKPQEKPEAPAEEEAKVAPEVKANEKQKKTEENEETSTNQKSEKTENKIELVEVPNEKAFWLDKATFGENGILLKYHKLEIVSDTILRGHNYKNECFTFLSHPQPGQNLDIMTGNLEVDEAARQELNPPDKKTNDEDEEESQNDQPRDGWGKIASVQSWRREVNGNVENISTITLEDGTKLELIDHGEVGGPQKVDDYREDIDAEVKKATKRGQEADVFSEKDQSYKELKELRKELASLRSDAEIGLHAIVKEVGAGEKKATDNLDISIIAQIAEKWQGKLESEVKTNEKPTDAIKRLLTEAIKKSNAAYDKLTVGKNVNSFTPEQAESNRLMRQELDRTIATYLDFVAIDKQREADTHNKEINELLEIQSAQAIKINESIRALHELPQTRIHDDEKKIVPETLLNFDLSNADNQAFDEYLNVLKKYIEIASSKKNKKEKHPGVVEVLKHAEDVFTQLRANIEKNRFKITENEKDAKSLALMQMIFRSQGQSVIGSDEEAESEWGFIYTLSNNEFYSTKLSAEQQKLVNMMNELKENPPIGFGTQEGDFSAISSRLSDVLNKMDERAKLLPSSRKVGKLREENIGNMFQNDAYFGISGDDAAFKQFLVMEKMFESQLTLLKSKTAIADILDETSFLKAGENENQKEKDFFDKLKQNGANEESIQQMLNEMDPHKRQLLERAIENFRRQRQFVKSVDVMYYLALVGTYHFHTSNIFAGMSYFEELFGRASEDKSVHSGLSDPETFAVNDAFSALFGSGEFDHVNQEYEHQEEFQKVIALAVKELRDPLSKFWAGSSEITQGDLLPQLVNKVWSVYCATEGKDTMALESKNIQEFYKQIILAKIARNDLVRKYAVEAYGIWFTALKNKQWDKLTDTGVLAATTYQIVRGDKEFYLYLNGIIDLENVVEQIQEQIDLYFPEDERDEKKYDDVTKELRVLREQRQAIRDPAALERKQAEIDAKRNELKKVSKRRNHVRDVGELQSEIKNFLMVMEASSPWETIEQRAQKKQQAKQETKRLERELQPGIFKRIKEKFSPKKPEKETVSKSSYVDLLKEIYPYISQDTIDHLVKNKLDSGEIIDDAAPTPSEPAAHEDKIPENRYELGPRDYRYKPKNILDDVETVDEYLGRKPDKDRPMAADWKDAHVAFADILKMTSEPVTKDTIAKIPKIVKTLNTTFSRMTCLAFDTKHQGTKIIAENAAISYYLNIAASVGEYDGVRAYVNGEPTPKCRQYMEEFNDVVNRIQTALGDADTEGKNKAIYNERIRREFDLNVKYCMKPQWDITPGLDSENPYIEAGAQMLIWRFWHDPKRMTEYVVKDEAGNIIGYTEDRASGKLFATWDEKRKIMVLVPGAHLPETYFDTIHRQVDPKRDLV